MTESPTRAPISNHPVIALRDDPLTAARRLNAQELLYELTFAGPRRQAIAARDSDFFKQAR